MYTRFAVISVNGYVVFDFRLEGSFEEPRNRFHRLFRCYLAADSDDDIIRAPDEEQTAFLQL